MPSAGMRAFLGFVAAAIAVLTFHQGMVAVLHALGLAPLAPFRTSPVPPLGVPWIARSLLLGWALRRCIRAACAAVHPAAVGLRPDLGIIAALVGMFVVAAIKHAPIANGWQAWPFARSLLINGSWGLGVGLILPLLMPRALVSAHP